MRRSDREKKETLLEAVLMFGLAFVVLLIFLWFIGSDKIVRATAGMLKVIGSPWALLDPEVWQKIKHAHQFYLQKPKEVTFSNYMAYANDCWRPWSFLFALGMILIAVLRFVRPALSKRQMDLKRQFKPMDLARELAKTFPAVIPVLHLGPDLMADKLPLWRRQTFPEDVWQNEKIAGQPLVRKVSGEDGEREELDIELVKAYFRGDEGKPIFRNKRRWSRMLGFWVVDVSKDAQRFKEICFPDRFSSAGKVIYALLAAYAFGGREGKQDFEKAAAQINQSCAGQKNGLPNLTVAQWIYDKYRQNPQAKKLFAIHHWEYTYLYALFKIAKKNGKVTHTSFIWLKPQDRILFYVLNTVGRATPHTEAAAAFAQYDFEVQCAKMKRLPVTLDEAGNVVPSIAITPAVEGLKLEFDRYQEAHDDDDDWWERSADSIFAQDAPKVTKA